MSRKLICRVLGLCLLAATPTSASLLSLTFQEYCDEISGRCGRPNDTYHSPTISTTSIVFDDGPITDPNPGPYFHFSYGSVVVDESRTGSVALVTGPHNEIDITAAIAGIYELSISVKPFTGYLDPCALYDQFLQWKTDPDLPASAEPSPFVFSESQTAVGNGGGISRAQLHHGFAYLVDVQRLASTGTITDPIPEPATFGLIAIALLLIGRRHPDR